MKGIKPIVYESLTPAQRVIASIEALARGDEEEKRRLVTSCPKKTYTMTDAAYSDKMEALLDMAMAVELDMRGCALTFFMLLYLEDNLDHDKHEKLSALMEKVPPQIQEIVSIKQAWHNFLEDEGIDPATMDSAYQPLRHFALEWITALADNMDLKPDPETVRKCKDVLKGYMGRAAG